MISFKSSLFGALCTALLLTGAGCSATSTPVIKTSPPVSAQGGTFNKSVTFSLQTSIIFEDGLHVFLNKIDDSRCPAGVQCIWQGELAPQLSLAGGEFGSDNNGTFMLGTVRTPETTVGPYTFKLVDATTNSITLIVSKGTSKPVEDIITITSPTSGQMVKSPLTITGKARGTWYFEASFPITLVDASGTVLASSIAQAQGDWMTTEFVPFTATVTFKTPTTTAGQLIFKKDNPSDLPENDDSRSLPVKFR